MDQSKSRSRSNFRARTRGVNCGRFLEMAISGVIYYDGCTVLFIRSRCVEGQHGLSLRGDNKRGEEDNSIMAARRKQASKQANKQANNEQANKQASIHVRKQARKQRSNIGSGQAIKERRKQTRNIDQSIPLSLEGGV